MNASASKINHNAPQEKYVVVGRLGRPYGLAGWQHVQSYTQSSQSLFQFKRWFILQKGVWQPFEVVAHKPHGSGWVARLQGITEKEQAALYSNLQIAVLRTELPVLPENEFYWADLEKLKVVTKTGIMLGTIDFLYENTTLDIMVVKDKGKERHIPFLLQDTVLEIDYLAGQVVVDWDFDIA